MSLTWNTQMYKVFSSTKISLVIYLFIKVKWVSDCCLMPKERYFSYIIARTNYIGWDDNDVHFVPDQNVQLEFYSVIPLKQQSVCRHVASLGHILIPNQPVFTLPPYYCLLSSKAANTNFMVFGLIRLGLEPTIYHT